LRLNKRSNMEPVFGAVAWPAQERARRRDATVPDARYVFASAVSAPDGGSSGDAAVPPVPLGFVHYRFVVEEEVPVLYVYELQVTGAPAPAASAHTRSALTRRKTEAARGKGLGRFLMLFVEMLARRSPGPLAGVMLTIQRANTRAVDFYTSKCKYVQDDISPAKARTARVCTSPCCAHCADVARRADGPVCGRVGVRLRNLLEDLGRAREGHAAHLRQRGQVRACGMLPVAAALR
jgi:hypothetical protein